MSARELTGKQEKFCQSYAKGMTQTDAYKSAYDTKNKTEKSIWELASRLGNNVKVTSRIAVLKEQVAKKQLWTREESIKTLRTIARKSIAKDNDKTGAVKELNSMLGFNSPKQIDLNTLNPMVIIRNGS